MMYYYLNWSATARKKKKENSDYFNEVTNRLTLYVSWDICKKPFRVSTSVEVNPKFWNKEKQVIKSGENNFKEKNKKLELFKTKLYDIENDALHEKIELTPSYLKEKFYPSINSNLKNNQNSNHFVDNWNKYLQNSINKTEGTKENYRNTLSHIIKFTKEKNIELAFYKIDKDFYELLLNYFFKEVRLTSNTAGKHIKNIKAFMKYCFEKGLTKNTDFTSFKVMKNKQILNYLKAEEIKTLYQMQFENKKLEIVRDIFLFGCLTGLRISDIKKITADNIRDNTLVLIVTKTKQPHSIYLHEYTKEILNKYNGKFPRINCQTYIRQIGELAGFNRLVTKVRYIGNDAKESITPLWQVMSMHLSKRTFIMLLAKNNATVDMMMEITGNKDRKTFEAYYEIIKDDANRTVYGAIDNLNLKG